MSRSLALDKIVHDQTIFPRGGLDQDAIMRYRDAYELGETLPALVLEKGTNRILDGWHRHAALKELGRDVAEIEYHVIPEGVPPLLYCAGLSSRHGVLLKNDDKKQVARTVFTADPDLSAEVVAQQLALNPRTVRRWVEDINEQRQKAQAEAVEIRRSAVVLLSACGLSQRQIASIYGVGQSTVRDMSGDGQVSEATHLRLATDPHHATAVLASIPEQHQPAAHQALQELLNKQQELVKERKQADEIASDWRELENAARAINGWINRGKRKPTGTPDERVTFITEALTNGVKALTEGNKR